MTSDLDYLAARLHGRRSRLAEAQRLDALCRIRSNPELFQTVYPGAQFQAVTDFQRQLVQDLVAELSGLLPHLGGADADLLGWMLVKFQVEDLKVLIRGIATKTPFDLLRGHLSSLPKGLAVDTQALAASESLVAFVKSLSNGTLRKSAEKAIEVYGSPIKPFFLEAALDRGYFQELLARAEQVSGQDKEVIKPLIWQEVDIFHLMLVARGKFHYGLTPALLLPLHIPGSRIPRARFAAMLDDPDLRTAAGRALGRVVDSLPPELKGTTEPREAANPAALEALAWRRFLHLANRAFRRSHIGLGVVAGYAGIRRVEAANLITLSEGIRNGVAAEAIRARMIPRANF